MKLFTSKPPWYAAGLAFECTECGRCCSGPEEGYVWVDDRQIARIADALGLTPREIRRQYTRRVGTRRSLVECKGSRDCIFLEADGNGKKHCRIYTARPRQCRTWPFWRQNLSSPDAWALASLRCPGINRGEKVFTLDEIEARLRHGDG